MRRTVTRLCTVLAFVACATTAVAQEPRGYDCTFDAGIIRTFENGAFTNKAAKKLIFEIGEIDLRAQTASLVTAKGTGDLRIVRAIGANHFLEVVTEGFLNITTIYATQDVKGPRPAVHSRHFGLFGTPVVSQYQGTCRSK
mgnify:CR=1 FL=1